MHLEEPDLKVKIVDDDDGGSESRNCALRKPDTQIDPLVSLLEESIGSS